MKFGSNFVPVEVNIIEVIRIYEVEALSTLANLWQICPSSQLSTTHFKRTHCLTEHHATKTY